MILVIVKASRLKSGSYVHFVGSPAFLLWYMLMSWMKSCLRAKCKSTTDRERSGRPARRSGRSSCAPASARIAPAARKVSLTLLPCIRRFIQSTYMLADNTLDPVRGTMFNARPPSSSPVPRTRSA